MGKRLTTEEFIKKSREVHGDKYDYSKVEYYNSKEKVCIICPKHGEFWQIPRDHYGKKAGCPKCGIESIKSKTSDTKEDFIKKAREKWEDFYNYDKINYINSKTKVEIICPIHGSFWQRPNDHLSNYGCPKCGIEKRAKNTTTSVKDFVRDLYIKFGDKIKLNEDTYINLLTPAEFACPIHGVFINKPAYVYKTKHGCPKCGYIEGGKLNKLSLEEFIQKAKKVYSDFYDYSKVEYIHTEEKVCIICPEHGEFWVTPHAFLQGCKCPKCSASLGELKIINYLEVKKIPYTFQYPIHLDVAARKTKLVKLDFYIEYNNKIIIIEFNGAQHYEHVEYFYTEEEFEEQQHRDEMLRQYCKNNDYILIEIPYYEIENISSILDNYFEQSKTIELQ